MALISLQNISIGLLGRNGMGKSTLLKLINGDILPHSGTIARQQNIRVAYLLYVKGDSHF